MTEITIDLLRHGDVAGGKKLLGSTDTPLSELGWQQVHSLAIEPWQKIVTSPLQRCHAFAEEISSQLSLPLEVNKQFQEVNFGQWDGQLLTDLYGSDDAEKLIQFIQSPSTITPPNGEAYNDFETRIMTAWQSLLTSLHEDKIEHCLLVTHGGVIRTIISNILGYPSTNLFRLEVPYACLSRIKQYDDYPPILSFHGRNL
ncbi:MAG: histidine phosphatase family protein [Methylophaga sp.]|nr:histidine phosphatase family protein [Methylophaga sp.]